jgi:hypothetical protein
MNAKLETRAWSLTHLGKGCLKIEAEQRIYISGYVQSRCIRDHPAQVLVQVQAFTLVLTGLVRAHRFSYTMQLTVAPSAVCLTLRC